MNNDIKKKNDRLIELIYQLLNFSQKNISSGNNFALSQEVEYQVFAMQFFLIIDDYMQSMSLLLNEKNGGIKNFLSCAVITRCVLDGAAQLVWCIGKEECRLDRAKCYYDFGRFYTLVIKKEYGEQLKQEEIEFIKSNTSRFCRKSPSIQTITTKNILKNWFQGYDKESLDLDLTKLVVLLEERFDEIKKIDFFTANQNLSQILHWSPNIVPFFIGNINGEVVFQPIPGELINMVLTLSAFAYLQSILAFLEAFNVNEHFLELESIIKGLKKDTI